MNASFPFFSTIIEKYNQAHFKNRLLIGIVGPPASGKSYLAERLPGLVNDHLGAEVASFLAMDGYHFFNEKLYKLGTHPHKGSHFTFDVQAFIEKLIEIKESEKAVRCPIYNRSLHDPTPNGNMIKSEHRIVFVEGNYLLSRVFPWITIRHLLDYCIYVEVDKEIQYERLLDRHTSTGKSPLEAEAKARRTDLPNSVLIERDKDRADYIYKPSANF